MHTTYGARDLWGRANLSIGENGHAEPVVNQVAVEVASHGARLFRFWPMKPAPPPPPPLECTYATTGYNTPCPDTPCVDWVGDSQGCTFCLDCLLGSANDLYCIASYIKCGCHSRYDNLDWNGASYVGSINQPPGPGSTQFADAVQRCDMSNNGLGSSGGGH